jgi:hypothetical protein
MTLVFLGSLNPCYGGIDSGSKPMIGFEIANDVVQQSNRCTLRRNSETEDDLKAFQRHLEDVLSGESFRSSHRSGQFLRHVVKQAVEGRIDSLKERVIGVELFKSEDTSNTLVPPFHISEIDEVGRKSWKKASLAALLALLFLNIVLWGYLGIWIQRRAPHRGSKVGFADHSLVSERGPCHCGGWRPGGLGHALQR